ncbi:hypothetical protein [Acidithiobacillus sp.]|uniref:hypothetical protein n=1 Tax=Acidithiobacillus sp. TaxID=1872118 RepID=UPI0026233121|nr:hypothetical protein [Acidithiobacillus sp.]MDD5278660.1 hypothetical protein [Acidithiobacillus sp.]
MGKMPLKITALALVCAGMSGVAFADLYSPAVPFQNKMAPSQIIGGVYIPSHEEPVMIQPGSVPFAAHSVSSTGKEQQALNNLASGQESQTAQAALANLQASTNPANQNTQAMNNVPPLVAHGPEYPNVTPSSVQQTLPIPNQTTSVPKVKVHIDKSSYHLIDKKLKESSINLHKHLQVTIKKAEIMPVYMAKGGVQMSTSLRAFLVKHGWKLLWNDKHDITPYFTTTYSGQSVANVLNQIQKIYPQFKIQMWGVNRVVTVTPYTNQNAMVAFDGGKQ